MTFTRAATRELSDRIRARLVEAAACFRGSQAPAAGDRLLQAAAQRLVKCTRSAESERACDLLSKSALHWLARAAVAWAATAGLAVGSVLILLAMALVR